MSKYKNKKVVFQGIEFDSIRERNEYISLLDKQARGLIFNLECQPKFNFELNGVNLGFYKADFQYNLGSPTGEKVVVDVKSEATQKIAIYRKKKKMMLAWYGIKIKEVM